MSLRQIWLGKSLAVAVPGVLMALIVFVLVLAAMNIMITIPAIGSPVFPGPLALLTALVIMPVMVFVVVCLVSFLQMVIANARLANLAFIVIFVAVYIVSLSLSSTGDFDFSLIFGIATVVLAGATYLVSGMLTKDRVTLSSKDQ